ncbi:MAG: ABC transporter substrate-binding protein [Clostridia bacterium]|nr:ABC transporter substrate-binding protein [Clostridia bacterium]
MKKLLLVALIVILTLVMVFAIGCKDKEVIPEGEYSIVSPDGAPAFALAIFAKDSMVSETLKVNPKIVSSTLIRAEAIKSDFAIVPANMASIIFNANEGYCMAASVTNGNMFIVSNRQNTEFTLNDLKGHVLYSIGQGSVPAFILLNTLNNAGIQWTVSETPVEGKVAIQYCADGQALLAKLKTATDTVYGNLAEPAVTTMVAKNIGVRVADLQTLWQVSTSSDIKGFAQAVLIVKKEIAQNHPEVVDAVINAIKNSEDYVVEHAQEARDNIATIYPETTLPSTMVAGIVRNCNVHVYRASENYEYINTTLQAAYRINAQSVGGSVPAKDSGFYY